MNWLDDVLHASSTAARAADAAATASPAGTAKTSAAAPPLCHLCRRGHLLREEALLHEWCCEGPMPEDRLHRGHNFIYATHNLQKYHFMRAQREARLVSTAPLQAQLLSVSPAALNGGEGQEGGSSFTMQPCEERNPQRRHTVRDAAAAATAPAVSSASLHPTRRAALTSAVKGHESKRSTPQSSTCPPALTQLTCEEGGSFVFSVHNPRLDVQLVWCAVNRQPREEAPSYARDGASGAVTVTPLLLWRCPPSLPGLPPRPYRVSIPYGLYAFANVHAVALYETRDIFRKATAQLAASAEAGQRLTAVTVAPSASLRSLLTVSILHHIAATPRPLAFVLRSGEDGGPPRKRARSATPPTATAGRAPEAAQNARSDAQRDAAAADVKWPDGLGAPELALCVDHLLHGRSVAVYGVASKHFFLDHVASSAALQAFRVVTVDASCGRAGVSLAGGTSSSSNNQSGGQRRAAQSMTSSGGGSSVHGSPSSTHSVMRQLHSLGHVLLRRVSEATVLTAETRAAMTAAAAAAEAGREAASDAPHANPPRSSAHTNRLGFTDGDRKSVEDATAAGSGAPMARALLPGDAGRSPAVARDVTAAMLHSAQHPQQQQQQQQQRLPVVDVVDVDSSLSSVPPSDTEGVAPHTAPPTTPPRCAAVSPSSSSPTPQRLLAGSTPLSQRLHATQLAQTSSPYSGGSGAGASAASPPPLPSPIPRLFATSQRSTSDGGGVRPARQSEETGEKEGEKFAALSAEGRHRRVVVCEELPEFSGPLNSLRLPPSEPDLSPHVEQRWRAAPVVYANDSVRRHVLQALRRQHASRRCVRWVSLPSTAASAAVAAQQQQQQQRDGAVPAPRHLASSISLVDAHALRPGWQPPVLLVLHNVDRLDAAEASVLLQLCAQFAFPHPHLQLLLSFDDPLWPLSSAASALSRLGVCAVQLRRLLLPRVHETLHMRSVHLLTDFEAATAAAAGGGGGGGRKTASGSTLPSGGNAGGSAVTGAGTSHLLQDTLRRVLFSLPPAFNALLRIVLDVQDDVGEGVFVSLFTITEKFEASGVMVSQGRLKALLRELTSNRIARYDSAEHALMVPQVGRLRRVLEEVTAQREGGGAGRSGG